MNYQKFQLLFKYLDSMILNEPKFSNEEKTDLISVINSLRIMAERDLTPTKLEDAISNLEHMQDMDTTDKLRYIYHTGFIAGKSSLFVDWE